MELKRRILLQEFGPPSKGGDIEWLCRSLGLLRDCDSDKSAYKVFKILAESSISGSPKTSAEIADELELARGTVLFHLKKFHSSGLLSRASGRRYILRESSLEDTLDDMMRDTERMFTRMRKIAADIDRELGVEKRW